MRKTMRIFSDCENKLIELLDGKEKKLFLDLVKITYPHICSA